MSHDRTALSDHWICSRVQFESSRRNQMVICWKWKRRTDGKRNKSDLKVSMCSCHNVRWRKKKKKKGTADVETPWRRGFEQLASDNSAFARMNSLRDYARRMPTDPGPFWPARNFAGRAYPTLMEPLGSINWISRGTRQMDGWMAGRNVREIERDRWLTHLDW